MTFQPINRGNYVDDPSADTAYEGAGKINDNFTELYGAAEGDEARLDAIEANGWVTLTRLLDGVLAASSTGLAKMADGFFGVSTAALAKFADGFFTATTAARAKFADAIWTNAKLANMANGTVKARITAGSGVPEDATGAQIRDSVLPAGMVVDRAYAEYTANTNLTLAIPIDGTIPQVGEGTQVLSVSITPKSITNRVRVRILGQGSVDATAALVAAMFINGAANAVRATYVTVDTNAYSRQFALEYEYVPGATTAQAITVRAGPSSGTARLNGATTGTPIGAVMATTIVVEELKA